MNREQAARDGLRQDEFAIGEVDARIAREGLGVGRWRWDGAKQLPAFRDAMARIRCEQGVQDRRPCSRRTGDEERRLDALVLNAGILF